MKKDLLIMLIRNRKVMLFLALFLCMAMLNVWFFKFKLSPVSGRAAGLESELSSAESHMVMTEDAISRYERYIEKRKQVALFKELLPSAGEYTNVLRRTYDLADKRHIQQSRFVVSSKDSFGDMEMVTFTLPVAGDYRDVRMFLHDVETSDLFLNIGSLTLSKAGKGNQISLSIGLSTYVRR